MVAHAVDVLAAGHIGLAGHHAAVCKLTHAQGVGQFNPFHSIDIHTQIPGVNFFGVNAQQQRKQTRHHQALNVVGITVVQRLRNGIAQASHVGVGSPIKRWQFGAGLHLVAL